MDFILEQFAGGTRFNLTSEEIAKALRLYDAFKTWGVMVVPGEDTPLNNFYLIPKKPIAPGPVNKHGEEAEIDYRFLAGVISNDTDSYFCCEYHYSYDEFRRTKYKGSFKIKICPENKMILDWIVKRRSLILMSRAPKVSGAFNIESMIKYLSKIPSIFLQINDISGLAFHNDYLDLIDPNKRGA